MLVDTQQPAARARPAATVPAVAAVALAALAALLTLVVAARGGAAFGVDLAVRELVAAPPGGAGRRVATVLTVLGGGPVLYPLLLGLGLAGVALRRSARELLPLLLFAVGQVLELVLFATLHRPAPTGGWVLPTTYSSGHTAAAVLGWGLVAWQAHRLHRAGPADSDRPAAGGQRAGWHWAVAAGIGLMVGATRVYLGLHWFTDAVAGLVTGAALLAAALLLTGRLLPPPGPRPATAETLRWWWSSLRAGLLLPPDDPTGASGRAASGEPPPDEPAPRPRPGRLGRVWAWLRGSPWAWSVPAVVALVPLAGLLATAPGERMKDLLVYHGAGGWTGAGLDVYAFRTEFAMPFTYPPFAALVLEPLSRMPLGLAQTLWTLATLAAVVALAATVLRPVAYRIGLPLTVTALLLCSPVRSHFRFGQVGVFLVLLVGLDLLRRTRAGGTQGWGLGLATAIKLTPAVYLPWLMLTRQWRRLAGTVAWLAGATLAGLVLLWPSARGYLRDASADTTRFGRNDIPGNQSVRGMLLRALPEPTAERLWLVLAVLLVGIALYQAWRCERAGDRLAAVGVLAAVSVAASPISWVHHLVWLAIPIAALAAAGRFRLVAAWFVILTVSFPFLGDGLAGAEPVAATVVTNLQGLTAVAAVLLLPTLVLRRHDP